MFEALSLLGLAIVGYAIFGSRKSPSSINVSAVKTNLGRPGSLPQIVPMTDGRCPPGYASHPKGGVCILADEKAVVRAPDGFGLLPYYMTQYEDGSCPRAYAPRDGLCVLTEKSAIAANKAHES